MAKTVEVGFVKTAEAAGLFGVKSATVRIAHADTGGYRGVKPVKLPNGHLRWPVDEIKRVMADWIGGVA